MIEKTDFPYTLGGYVEQQNYKGFDIARFHSQIQRNISLCHFLGEKADP